MVKKVVRKKSSECNCNSMHCCCHPGKGGIYGLGFIGAAIYYVSTATSFWMGVLGILKAIVWPAIVVFGALKAVGI